MTDKLKVVAWRLTWPRMQRNAAGSKLVDRDPGDSWGDTVEPLVLESEALPALNAALERVKVLEADARRYQWLRYGDNDEVVLMVYDGKVRRFDHRFDNAWLPRNEKLDAAIDVASMAGKGTTP